MEKDYNISDDPEYRAIAGASSGAICAFTVAWHRPDQFRKVISTIGSFTNIRGGHVYPELIRQSERKPIRIFLQDGLNDIRGRRRGGDYDPKWDWHAQNRKMVAALTEKGYDVNYCWGIGTHSNKQGGRHHARDAPLALARLSSSRRPDGREQPHAAGAIGIRGCETQSQSQYRGVAPVGGERLPGNGVSSILLTIRSAPGRPHPTQSRVNDQGGMPLGACLNCQ